MHEDGDLYETQVHGLWEDSADPRLLSQPPRRYENVSFATITRYSTEKV